ncbi:hypothetical protein FRUB_04871 [Fimbriiglobus ruber]|uniref:Uncharacterized protein n=1 Tax=Fimbriiglobus ruber TaxID=1908690 RepID=A0A225DV02_9BACT|nr:hypothetical protein FRUB_04871 [Fimbriiglobus ruber]
MYGQDMMVAALAASAEGNRHCFQAVGGKKVVPKGVMMHPRQT